MAILEVLTIPNPFLSQKALLLTEVDDNIRKSMDDMLETMHDKTGVGLAANQVGILKRIIVLDLRSSKETEGNILYPPFMANPKIIYASDEYVERVEGCLSIPGLRVTISRPNAVKVKFIDYNNNRQEIESDGWFACAVQHEIDHLDGKMMTEYLSGESIDL